MTKAPRSSKAIVVTGDVTIDWNLARAPRQRRYEAAWNADDRTRACWQPGGAAMLAEVIEEMTKGTGVQVLRPTLPDGDIHPADPRFHHSYAIWNAFPSSSRDNQRKVWRVKEFLGLDKARAGSANGAGSMDWMKETGDPDRADVVVLDDAALGFRRQPELWPDAATNEASPGWVLMKMASPVAEGALWERLANKCAHRLVVIVTVNDLRRSEVQISRELSWERTAQDIFWELANNPKVKGLSRCAHVIVSFGASGALHLSNHMRPESEGTVPAWDCKLFFDPLVAESTWGREYTGDMIGFTTCLTSAIAQQLVLAPDSPAIDRGIQSGVAAMRMLQQIGYGAADASLSSPPRFPTAEVVRAMEDPSDCLVAADVQDPVRYLSDEPGGGRRTARPESWSILDDQCAPPKDGRGQPFGALEDMARRIVKEGQERVLNRAPMSQFGRLVTADRREIEGYRSIHSLFSEYCRQSQQKPLSVAVFGPPGSGKSFGVKEVAGSIDDGEVEPADFNLSQFYSTGELTAAFHQVRDIGLSGKTPLVFWDEFDTSLGNTELGWLRYFLAPMQDGTFQDGQITYHIGRAIFVFAGGTKPRMEAFAHPSKENRSKFVGAKGPDFVSRLRGYVNVMGPNPGDVRYPAGDPHYVIRRAVLLRGLLLGKAPSLFLGPDGKGDLDIDSGVLRAFLKISEYKHGARSMESIIAMSMLFGKSHFERSCLPSETQLNLHVDGMEFLALVQQPELKGEVLEVMASANHEAYRESQKDIEDAPETTRHAYSELAEEYKEQNREFVRGIPNKLSAISHVMIPARGNQPPFGFPGKDLDRLSEMEHERWLRAKVRDGWRYASGVIDEANRTNPAVLPWRKLSNEEWAQLDPDLAEAMTNEDLPEEQKDKDRALIGSIPYTLAKAGYAVVKLRISDRANP